MRLREFEVTSAARLTEALALLPPGSSVTLPRETLLEALAPAIADLSVGDLGRQLRRSPSTVRGWLHDGRFKGAYKLNGRDWRVPAAAIAAFLEGQRPEAEPEPGRGPSLRPHKARKPAATGTPVTLDAWRNVKQKGRAA